MIPKGSPFGRAGSEADGEGVNLLKKPSPSCLTAIHRLAAARSHRGSESHLGFHSLPRCRFATRSERLFESQFFDKFPFTDDEPASPDYSVSVELCAFSAKEMLSAQAVFGAEAPARQ